MLVNRSHSPDLTDPSNLASGLGACDDHTFYIFQQQLELERRIERVKIALSLKTDFNLIDAFRIFTDARSVNVADIKHGLFNLGLNISADELLLFMKRFDQDHD